MTLGAKIKKLRIENGLTLEELGKIVDVHKSTILKYENGNVVNLKIDNIIKLAKFFNVTPNYLLGFEDANEDKNTDTDSMILCLYKTNMEFHELVENAMSLALSKNKKI